MSEAESTEPESTPFVQSNRAFGTDEMNLCEFPLAACGHRTNPEQKSLAFEDEIFDEGNQQLVQRKLVISASDAFGLPTPVDSDVLLVLMHLTNCRTQFQSPTVNFTRYELVKFLGYDNSGKSYKRLEESLQRWASVTLFYNQAWWDKDRRRWRSQTFHVLESLDLRGRDGRSGADDDGQSSFTWNKVLFSSFQSNHLKRLDLGTYFRLQNPAARQMYRFLDKRFYRSQRFEMDLRVFACEHVGLARTYDNAQLKRKLQPGLEELESIGFLVPVPASQRFVRLRHGEWQIVLQRQHKGNAVPIRKASGESLDLKSYEADMRHLLDTYIEADEPRKISPFDDMPLLELIVKSGIAQAINSLPDGIKSNHDAVAETIENNVRKRIVKEHLNDPAYFETMSKLLEEIIAARKSKALEYEEYLKKIAALAKQVEAGQSEETPEELNTPGRRALFNNLGRDADLAMTIDETVRKTRPDGWRGVQAREQIIKAGLYGVLQDEAEVERIFLIIKQQKEY